MNSSIRPRRLEKGSARPFAFALELDDAAVRRRENEARVARGELFTPQQMADATDAARAEGLAAGSQAEREASERQIAHALAGVERALGDMQSTLAAAIARHRDDSLVLAVAIARCLAGRAIDARPFADAEELIADCLGRLGDEPRVVVRVPDAMVDHIQDRLESIARQTGYAGRFVLLGDAALGPRDCRVEWADGGAEVNADARAAAVAAALDTILPQSAEPAAD